ncbi:GNAT family N-acetyltransferase [Candidatus Mcinerneyibacteriota bacterium]|nr:GNAT family N-acetyltransferase [Candidatus Mcinerneyibacteriota bacterium]
MRIVPFDMSHYETVYSLWSETPGIGLSTSDGKEEIASFLKRNPGLSFIALSGEETAGTILCGHDGRRGYIYHLCVSPHFRHQGIAATLMEKSLEGLRRSGIKKCHLFVLKENREGYAFWTHSSWQERTDLTVFSLEP